ncbi:MAG TPA: extensin family protein [Bauldia sp.]|nr:extensin family protein [Bauldia sp.]
MLATAIVVAGASAAHAVSPIDFVQRFLANPANVFGTAPKVKRKPAAQSPALQEPQTPLVEVPLPHLRPATAEAVPRLGYQPDDADAGIDAIATEDMPLPRLRPSDLLPALTEKPTLQPDAPPPPKVASLPDGPLPDVDKPVPKPAPPAPKVASLPDAPLPDLVKPPPAVDSACGVAIAQLGVISTPLAPVRDEGDCGIENPVAISALDGGDIKFTSKAIVDCHLAERLANWVNDTVKPKVQQEFGEPLTGLRIAASYACRNRDSLPDTKISEHAHGNAIDISAFRVGERWVDVEKDWGNEDDETAATFLAETRKSACGPFSTVLGPGSDSFHSNHFHLDMIQRRTAGPSKGLYCH